MTFLALVLAALIPLAAADSAENAFAAGEEALRQDRVAEAEARYREALEMDPHHLRAMIRLANVVSWDNRLEESIALFESARSLDPGNRQARLGLARVSSWAGRYPQAIAIYGRLLEENPRDWEAAAGLGRTHAWAGHHEESRRIYRELLMRDPGNVEARVGLAQVLSWDGELDAALDLYDEALELAPGNREALKGRAQVLLWQGRLPQAWDAAGEALAVNPADRRSMELDRSVRQSFAPVVTASAGTLHDSDRNAIDTQSVGWSLAPTLRTTLGFGYERFDASRPREGAPTFEARLESLLARASWRVGEDLVLSGSAGLDRISREECAGLIPDEDCGKTTHARGSAAADYRLNDKWSFSGSLSRETLEATAESLIADVGIAAATAGVHYAPVPRVGTRLAVQRADMTDDNQRDLVLGYARWSVPVRRPRLSLSWLGRAYFCDRPGTGYFCPDSYLSNVGGLEITDGIGPRFQWSVQGTLGVQRVDFHETDGASSDTVRGYYARVSYDFGRGFGAEAYFGSTNLALAAGSGYDWTEAGARIRWRLDRFGRAADRGRPRQADDVEPSTAGRNRQ